MNRGKFVDRNPNIRAAGIVGDVSENIPSLFKSYTMEEMAEYMTREKCRKVVTKAREMAIPCFPKIVTNEVHELLTPELQKSRFVVFREKFSENVYFQKPELGKSMPVFSKPDHITNESQTFGARTKLSDTSLYELVFPQKSISQVNNEYISFHDKKIISHRHYFPSERINRHYISPPFNANDAFGILVDIDKDGSRVKKCLQEPDSSSAVISKVQKEFIERTQGALGKKIKSLCANVSEDMIMGCKSIENECTAKDVIENLNCSHENKEILDAAVHLKKLRRHIFTRRDLHINDLRQDLISRDVLKIGYLPYDAIIEVIRNSYIHIDVNKIYSLLKYCEMIRDVGKPSECVDYQSFCRLLQVQYPLPAIPKPILSSNIYNKRTIYRDMCNDISLYRRVACKEESSAQMRLKVLENRIKSADNTTAKDAISPDIPTQFGLNPSEFELPRSKDDLRRIFRRVLCGDNFDEIWLRVSKLFNDPAQLYTVNEFRQVMNTVRAGDKIDIAKQEISGTNREEIHKLTTPLEINQSRGIQVEKTTVKSLKEGEKIEEKPLEMISQNDMEKKKILESIDAKAGGDTATENSKNLEDTKKVYFKL